MTWTVNYTNERGDRAFTGPFAGREAADRAASILQRNGATGVSVDETRIDPNPVTPFNIDGDE